MCDLWMGNDQTTISVGASGKSSPFLCRRAAIGKDLSYEGLCHALEARFGGDRIAAVFKAELQQWKQRQRESLPALDQEIRRLVKRAYPSFMEMAMEELSVEKFIDALEGSAMRLSIHQIHPTQLEQAIKHALKLEAW